MNALRIGLLWISFPLACAVAILIAPLYVLIVYASMTVDARRKSSNYDMHSEFEGPTAYD